MKIYSKRLLLPFVGVVQVADLGWARALSLDGKNWAIRYAMHENDVTMQSRHSHDPRINLSLMITIQENQHNTRVLRTGLNPEKVNTDSQRLFDALNNITVPFNAADHYEYWLLDSKDEQPLAMLSSCVNADEMQRSTPRDAWLCLPAAELKVPDPDADAQDTYQPPINYRLQQLIDEHAGSKPRAIWVSRNQQSNEDFPSCLIRDEWDDQDSQRLVDLYLQRLAPRLLMIDGLPQPVRQRLEQAACDYVFEVEQFCPLYPAIIDKSLLNAARVEARLRRANEVSESASGAF